MDILLKIFEFFVSLAKNLAEYIPQDKESVLAFLRQIMGLLGGLNNWIASTLGINFQRIFSVLAGIITKYFYIAFNFIIELIKKLAERG